MSKSISIGRRPSAKEAPATADAWVDKRQEAERMKRLTLDISADLHRRIKIQCAERGTKIVEEIRALLEQEYPSDRT